MSRGAEEKTEGVLVAWEWPSMKVRGEVISMAGGSTSNRRRRPEPLSRTNMASNGRISSAANDLPKSTKQTHLARSVTCLLVRSNSQPCYYLTNMA